MAPASAAPVADLNCTITVDTDVHPGLTQQLRHINSISGGLTLGTRNGRPDGATSAQAAASAAVGTASTIPDSAAVTMRACA